MRDRHARPEECIIPYAPSLAVALAPQGIIGRMVMKKTLWEKLKA